MGAVANDIADFVIVTDDNPRTEAPSAIRQEIIKAITEPNKYIEIANREAAIERAVALMEKNDILLIAGKGHEDYQIIGTTKHPFSDIKLAKKYIQDRK